MATLATIGVRYFHNDLDLQTGLFQKFSVSTKENHAGRVAAGTVINLDQTSVTSPIVLNQANATYILQDNLTCAGSCFVVTASGITLDLNTKTATFGTDSGIYRYGVTVPSDYPPGPIPYDPADISSAYYRSADNFILKNGSLLQGGTGTQNMVFFSDEGCHQMEISNITARYQGIDSQGFVLINGRNFNIHDNTIQANLSQITNRQHAKSAIGIASRGGTLYIRNNTIYGNGQFGISASTKRVFPMTAAEISGNTMRINGITTNPYQLVIYGFSKKYQGVTLKIFNNQILSPDNTANRGLILDGIDPSMDGTDGAQVYDNYISTKEHGFPEYGDAGWTHGFRMRDPDFKADTSPYTFTKFFNNEFYNNTFKTTAYYNSSTDNGDGISVRISLNSPLPAGASPNIFHDNTIISQTLNANKTATAIGLEGHDATVGTIFRDNLITSDTNILGVTWQGGSGALFQSNTFQKGTNPNNFKPVSYNNAINSTDNIFLDTALGTGVDLMDVIQRWMGEDKPNERRGDRSFYVKWTLNLSVKNNAEEYIVGAQISVVDKNGTTAFTGTTNATGNASTILSQYYWRQAPSYPSPSPVTTTYNPYTITISKSGVTQTQTVVMDATKTINMTLNVEGGIDVTPPAAVTDLQAR